MVQFLPAGYFAGRLRVELRDMRDMPDHLPPRRPCKVAAVVPAYNEENRIGAVLQTLTATPEVDEVIVVSDGSTDCTPAAAAAFEGVRVVRLPRNKGKGGAMREGALLTDADVLVFFDADLIGLTPAHVRDLVMPVCCGAATMATGTFQGGRFWTDVAQYFSPGITGQRAIRRDVFLRIPGLDTVGYGIELAITYFVRHRDLPIRRVIIRGVTHPMKEQKLGFFPGAISRAHMYWQMLRFRVSYEWHGRPPRPKKNAPPEEEGVAAIETR